MIYKIVDYYGWDVDICGNFLLLKLVSGFRYNMRLMEICMMLNVIIVRKFLMNSVIIRVIRILGILLMDLGYKLKFLGLLLLLL